MKSLCPRCGGFKSQRAEVCIRCRVADLGPQPSCVDCGSPIARRGLTRCWECYLKNRRSLRPTCRTCTQLLPRANKTGLCGDCFKKVRRNETVFTCTQCGEELKPQNPTRTRKSGLCYDCYRMHMRKNPPTCEVEDCSEAPIAKGLCRRHYYQRYARTRRYGSPRQSLRKVVAALPCTVCGYNKLSSHIHRVIPALGYAEGNVVPLCANCHNEVHAGYLTLPDNTLYSGE